MNELTNIDIHIISLVDKGANKKNIIWKSTSVDTGNHTYTRNFTIQKTDEEKKIVYGIVYSPDEEDAHGDFATEMEIEKACYNFMRKSNNAAIDTQHDLDTDKSCFIGESWIVKSNDAFFPEDVGAWAVGIKIENEEIWKSVKSGEFTGISMYGYAEKTAKSDDDKFEKGILNFFRKHFSGNNSQNSETVVKDFNERMAAMDFPKLIDAIYSACYDILYNQEITDKSAAILESIDQFKTYVADIQIAKSISKAGKMVSDTNMKKLQTAMESIQAILDAAGKSIEKKESKIIKSEGETEMTPEEIKKQIEDALKPVTESNELLKTENADLKKRLEEIEKKSTGSNQNHNEPAGPGKEEVKKVFPWATLGSGK